MLNQREQPRGVLTRYDFDQVVERRGTDSTKWNRYEKDVLPLWVADMDFVSPEPVISALRRRVEHGILGYTMEPVELRAALQARLQALYGWQVEPAEFTIVPGTVTGLNLACRAIGESGSEVLVQPPIYPPFYSAPRNAARQVVTAPLVYTEGGYEIDFDVFERAITPGTRLFLLCNPHNPTGRVFTRTELERMAEICLRRGLAICSDEIHQDFVYRGHRHTPIASLDPEVADRTITLLAPSKSFNIPGLHFSFAHARSPELRAQLVAAGLGLVDHALSSLGYVAALAAFREGAEWLAQVVEYLEANRDFASFFVRENLPGVKLAAPQGTYLAWLDCRATGIEGDPVAYFLEKARVALSPGEPFGPEGRGFARLNFGCSRLVLEEALERMRQALPTRRLDEVITAER